MELRKHSLVVGSEDFLFNENNVQGVKDFLMYLIMLVNCLLNIVKNNLGK